MKYKSKGLLLFAYGKEGELYTRKWDMKALTKNLSSNSEKEDFQEMFHTHDIDEKDLIHFSSLSFAFSFLGLMLLFLLEQFLGFMRFRLLYNIPSEFQKFLGQSDRHEFFHPHILSSLRFLPFLFYNLLKTEKIRSPFGCYLPSSHF